MTETFTASNGRIRVDYEETPHERIDIYAAAGGENMLEGAPWLGREEVSALRDFFQHERDEELGRWRWPENSDYVVYLRNDGQACVFNEATGVTVYRFRGEHEHLEELRRQSGEEVMPHTHAARAYFEAHPERKPWEDAKAGDVWVIEVEGTESFAVHVVAEFFGAVSFQTPTGRKVNMTNSTFTGFRKIWPEDAS